MDQNLQTLTNYALVGFTFTALIAPLLIWGLYKMNIVVRHVLTKNKMNQEFINIHAHKSGTPTMGGLMISLTVLIWGLILIPASSIKTVFLIGWFLTSCYGFVEGAMVFARKVDEKFKLFQETFGWRIGKLVALYAICVVCLVLIKQVVGVEQITLIGNLVVPLNPLVIILGGIGMVLSLYGMEITDGADGLVTGQFIVAFITYIAIVGVTGHQELLPYLGLMLGSAFVYLYFNINPARVFMGGTGTLPIGFALVMFAIITDTLLPFIIMGVLFWVELFSSASQIIAIKFFNTKIFRIAPIHHHFEAVGWSESKVVQRFWLGSAVAALAALWIFSML